MDNLYLFVIWSKALFAKERITKDLESNFEIKLDIFVEWSKDNFGKNLEAMYGRKISNTQDKIDCCGDKPFNVIIVQDSNPSFGYRLTHDGDSLVNTRIFDKKDEYRRMVGGSFRVHGSSNEEEFRHDVVVILGPDFINLMGDKTPLLRKDTCAVTGFESDDDFELCMFMFGNNKLVKRDNKFICFAKCRLDVERFVGNREMLIYGEAEGDIPAGMVDALSKEMIDDFFDMDMHDFVAKYGFEIPVKKDSMRISSDATIFDKVKREAKLLIAKSKI